MNKATLSIIKGALELEGYAKDEIRATIKVIKSKGRERLMTIKEVSQMLNVSTRTISRWVEAKALPVTKLTSRKHRYRLTDVNELIEQGVKG